jgi:hypothetical protein
MGQVILVVILVCVVLAVISFAWSMARTYLQTRRHIRRIREFDAGQEEKPIEDRLAERGLSDVASRHPSAARLIVETSGERQDRQAQHLARGIPVNDPSIGWNDLWVFARNNGITNRDEIDATLGYSSSGLTASQCRYALAKALDIQAEA